MASRSFLIFPSEFEEYWKLCLHLQNNDRTHNDMLIPPQEMFHGLRNLVEKPSILHPSLTYQSVNNQ